MVSKRYAGSIRTKIWDTRLFTVFILKTRGTMKKAKFTTTAAVTAAVIIGVAGTTIGANTYAATTSGSVDPGNKLITAIAQKFNLNPTDVQKVFDEQRTQMQTEHEQKIKERLTKAVAEGKLTQAQVDALIAKKKEFMTKGGLRMGSGHPGFEHKGFGRHEGSPKDAPRGPTQNQ